MKLEYIFERRLHTYTWETDNYQLDPNVPKTEHKTLERICTELRKTLVPKLALFRDFEAAFIDPMLLGHDMGQYQSHTFSHPYFALNYEYMYEHHLTNTLPLDIWIGTTLVHEMGHAVQDACGIQRSGRFAEKQAEDLAYHWYTYKQIPDSLIVARLALEAQRLMGKLPRYRHYRD